MPGHLGAFLRRQFIGRSKFEPSAVDIEHHRARSRQARRPDVQLQHVLALVPVVPVLKERLFDRCEVVEVLPTVRPVHQSGVFVLPGLRRFRRKPAVFAACVLAIGNALEGENAAIEETSNLAVLGFRDCRAGRGAVAGFLVRGGFGAVECERRPVEGEAHAHSRRQKHRLTTAQKRAILRI